MEKKPRIKNFGETVGLIENLQALNGKKILEKFYKIRISKFGGTQNLLLNIFATYFNIFS